MAFILLMILLFVFAGEGNHPTADLDATEAACAEIEIGLDELTRTPSATPSS